MSKLFTQLEVNRNLRYTGDTPINNYFVQTDAEGDLAYAVASLASGNITGIEDNTISDDDNLIVSSVAFYNFSNSVNLGEDFSGNEANALPVNLVAITNNKDLSTPNKILRSTAADFTSTSGGYLDLTSAGISFPTQAAYSFWVRFTSGLTNGETNYILWAERSVGASPTPHEISLRYYGNLVGNSTLRVQRTLNGVIDVDVMYSASSLDDGNWHHIVITSSRSNLYVDSVIQSWTDSLSPSAQPILSIANLNAAQSVDLIRIGQENSLAQSKLLIDNFRFIDEGSVVINQALVNSLYAEITTGSLDIRVGIRYSGAEPGGSNRTLRTINSEGDLEYYPGLIADNTFIENSGVYYKQPVESINTSQTLTDGTYFVRASGTITLTLPQAAGQNGRIIHITNEDTGIITIQADPTDTIGNSTRTSIDLNTQYTTIEFISNGDTIWYVI
jgi:hypothetical protein